MDDLQLLSAPPLCYRIVVAHPSVYCLDGSGLEQVVGAIVFLSLSGRVKEG